MDSHVFLEGSGMRLGGAKRAVVLAVTLFAALAVLMAVAPGEGRAAAPPTGEAGVAISTAPAGTVAGSLLHPRASYPSTTAATGKKHLPKKRADQTYA